jgi:lysophospholipase L1-like esterase
VRFLALGDSYTIGEGVADQERWPNHLARMLRDRGVAVDDPHIIARTAWTTDELADAIADENRKGPYDFVSLLIGVNDQYRSRPVQSFALEFALLLRRSIAFAGRRPHRVLVVSIPDWGATPFAEGRDRALITREVEAYNVRGRELAMAAGTTWVDVTGISRSMMTDAALVTPDGLHPSGEMYRRWAELMLPVALAALKRRSSR